MFIQIIADHLTNHLRRRQILRRTEIFKGLFSLPDQSVKLTVRSFFPSSNALYVNGINMHYSGMTTQAPAAKLTDIRQITLTFEPFAAITGALLRQQHIHQLHGFFRFIIQRQLY